MVDKSIRAVVARANGAKSKGPVTPEGKARSAMNAVTHGLCGANVVLDHESRPVFEALLASFMLALQPVGAIEAALVHDLAAARWRLCRAWGMETASIDLEIVAQAPQIAAEFESADENTVTALAFRTLVARPGAFTLVSRYEARHRRTFERALRNLLLVQRVRKSEKEPVFPIEPR